MTEESRATAEAKGRIGRLVRDKWRLARLLGVGGMASVYEAKHRNGARVALKMMHKRFAADPDLCRRFLREAYLANAVGHPSVVVISDDEVDEEGTPFLVMELLEGRSVEAMRRGVGGKLDEATVLDVADQVLGVLAVAHEKGIVHRDIKPSNLFMTHTGEVKVLDFGIAGGAWLGEGASALTQDGSFMGTPAFMAPEQARARWREVDARTDLWALGATMFTLLSGRDVHVGETPAEQLGFAMTVPALSLAQIEPGTPHHLVRIVDRALEYDRADRWQTARDMLAACRGYDAEAETKGPPSSTNDERLVDGPSTGATGMTLRNARTLRSQHDLARRPIGRRVVTLGAALAVVSAAVIFARMRPAATETSPNVDVVNQSRTVSEHSRSAERPPSETLVPAPEDGLREQDAGRPSSVVLAKPKERPKARPAPVEPDAGPAEAIDPFSQRL